MQYLCLFALAALAQTCLGGGLYSGVSTSTVEGHGPLARLAVDSMASGALHYHAPVSTLAVTAPAVAPVDVIHHAPVSPLALTAPVAPVDVVHHIPSVADVPVTKYVNQPGYVQKLVDVHKSKLAVAKLQVRRPAIQKQFYDIEERTIIRPVGSAVVEFEEPVSKKFVTPFTVTPVSHFQRPLAYPVGSYPFFSYVPFQTPVQQFNPVFVQQTPQQNPFPQPPQQNPFPQPPQQNPFPQPPQQYPVLPQQPATSPPQPPQQIPSFPQAPQPSPDDSPSNSEFDSSDTVVVDNPDFGRSRPTTEPRRANEKQDSFEEFEKEVNGQEIKSSNFEQDLEQEQMIRNILNDFESRQILRALTRQSKKLSQQRQNFQILLEPPLQLQQQHEQLDNQLNEDQPFQRSQDTTSKPTSETSTQTENSTRTTTGTTIHDHAATESATHSGPEFRTSFDSQEEKNNEEFNAYSDKDQFNSDRHLSPEELQGNQQKLVELLTGRGEVSEVGLSRTGVKLSPVGNTGVVRGRVVSVTPAPSDGEGQERVYTRRLVVSRPVHTVEEVDVKQPFTKVERVAVHEPALVKTAHTHIARVPTAVPVLTRSFTPVLYH